MRYPIPQQSARAWEQHKSASPQNPGLVFERFSPDLGQQPEAKKGELKRDSLMAVRDAAAQADRRLLEAMNARWQHMVMWWYTRHSAWWNQQVSAEQAQPFTLRTEWRLVAGLGRKGALEVGFTFQRYGFPILPGSGLKGLARSWALGEIAERLQPELVDVELLNRLDKFLSETGELNPTGVKEGFSQAEAAAVQLILDFRRIFGSVDQIGHVIFFDAIPSGTRLPVLELDVMTPHFKDYYQDDSGRTPPTDWQDPNPISFLTVAHSTEFRFALGWRGELNEDTVRLRNLAREWMVAGLTQLGAGAKTNAGYGYFQAPDESAPSRPAAHEDSFASQSESLSQPKPTAQPAATDLHALQWKRGRVTKDQHKVLPVGAPPEQALAFKKENILPKDYTPPGRAEVDYAVETLPGGSHRVWVKKLFYPV